MHVIIIFFPVSYRFSLSPPFPKQKYIPILVRVFFSWHAHESGSPRWARR